MTAGNYVNSLLVSVRLDILRSVKLNTRREILYLRAPTSRTHALSSISVWLQEPLLRK